MFPVAKLIVSAVPSLSSSVAKATRNCVLAVLLMAPSPVPLSDPLVKVFVEGYGSVATPSAVDADSKSLFASVDAAPKNAVLIATLILPSEVGVPDAVVRRSVNVAAVIVAPSGIDDVSKLRMERYCRRDPSSPIRIVVPVELFVFPTFVFSPDSRTSPSSEATTANVTVTGVGVGVGDGVGDGVGVGVGVGDGVGLGVGLGVGEGLGDGDGLGVGEGVGDGVGVAAESATESTGKLPDPVVVSDDARLA